MMNTWIFQLYFTLNNDIKMLYNVDSGQKGWYI